MYIYNLHVFKFPQFIHCLFTGAEIHKFLQRLVYLILYVMVSDVEYASTITEM